MTLTYMNYLVHHLKVLKDYLFLLIITANNDEACIKNNRKYFLSRAKAENYNILIDARNFYDQPINDLTKQ